VRDLLISTESCIAVDSALPLPEKDFKARLESGRVKAVGIEFFGSDCVACQPIYHMRKNDMLMWLDEIERFCASGERNVYAEKALNNITDKAALFTVELGGRLCNEIDNTEDLNIISSRFMSLIESERNSI
jgi:phosphoenolpyruvate phosphomutase